MIPGPRGSIDEEAEFSAAYRTYASEMRRFGFYLSGDAALADDLVSEAFMRAWTTRDRIRFPTVRGYLFAIVRNLFLEHRRRARRARALDHDAVDSRPSPETIAADHDRLRVVLAALDALPDVDRAAVLMRADEGLAYEEIAAALGLSISAAKVKVHRARLKLAEALDAETALPGPKARVP